MKGYVVCVYKNIANEEKLKEYAIKARIAVEKYKGKFLMLKKMEMVMAMDLIIEQKLCLK